MLDFGYPVSQEQPMSRRWLAMSLLTVIVMLPGVAAAAIIPGVDSIYPTDNTNWACTSSSTPGGSLYCLTDNSSLTFGMETMTAARKNVIRTMMSTQYNPTDLNTSEQTPIVYSGSAETDIVFQAASPPSGANGVTWCNDGNFFGICDQHYVMIKPDRITSTASTPCHETGHAVGLTHGANADPTVTNGNSNLECMRTPGTSVTTLGAHNRNQINGVY